MFHTLSGYDAHLFIRELGAHTSDMEVTAKNKEDYISFSIKVPVEKYIDRNGEEKVKLIELRFIDSFKFMSSSLDSLTKNLVSEGKKLFGLEDYSELQYDLLNRKGVYPYEYVNSWDRFNETQLLPIDAFYSNLKNNLYGWAMSQPLPTGGFKWVHVNPNEISELATRTDKGYILEVDVSYPKDLHDSHNDPPFMCERMEINGVEKLVPNLRDKKNYVIHIQALMQALQHGLRLDRIRRAIEFDQMPWLKTYIDFNTQLRTAATNDFEIDFFK